MSKNRKAEGYVGFARSDVATYTIPNGNNGGNLGAVDLGRNYLYIVITCADMTGIAATTNMTAEVAYDPDDATATLYERDLPQTQWSKGNLPTSGSFAFCLVHALGAQKIKLLLSQNTDAEVVFRIYGIGTSIAG